MHTLGQCRGQAYDGASNIFGRLNGVTESEQPLALYVHCVAHSLNLCRQDVTCSCTYIRDALELTREIVILIKRSAKQSHHFEVMKSQLSLIQLICDHCVQHNGLHTQEQLGQS